MPIRPENRDRYPPNWREISAAVREEAGQKCEWCSAPNGVMIRRGLTHDGRHVWREASASAYENGYCADNGSEVADSGEDTCDYRPAVRVVLTVAHLDHQPENCERSNLKALCQRCHNRYDAKTRASGIAAREREKAAERDMFSVEAPTGAPEPGRDDPGGKE